MYLRSILGHIFSVICDDLIFHSPHKYSIIITFWPKCVRFAQFIEFFSISVSAPNAKHRGFVRWWFLMWLLDWPERASIHAYAINKGKNGEQKENKVPDRLCWLCRKQSNNLKHIKNSIHLLWWEITDSEYWWRGVVWISIKLWFCLARVYGVGSVGGFFFVEMISDKIGRFAAGALF